MANEIQLIHDDGAETVYAIVRDMLGNWWHVPATAAFGVFAAAQWAHYAITLTEVEAAASGNVAEQGTFPSTIPAGFYWLDVYVQAGANPAQTDFRVSSCLMYWNGAGGTLTPKVPATVATGDAADMLSLGILLSEICGIQAYGTCSFGGGEAGSASGACRFAGFYNGMPYFNTIITEGVLWWHSGTSQWRYSGALGENTNYFSYTPVNYELTYEAFVINGSVTGTCVFYLTPYIGATATPGSVILTDLFPGNLHAVAEDANVAKEASVGAIATILTGITSLAAWLRGLFRKDAINAAALSEINAIHDGGSAGTFSATTDSNEAIYDNLGPAALAALAAYNTTGVAKEASVGNIDSTGGTLSLAKAVEAIVAWSQGKCTYNAATGVATYYGQDGTTVILTTPLLGGGNRDKPTIN